MTGAARQEFPGRLDQVACARAFVKSALGDCPALDDIVLLASELCANAVRHSASADGGSFEVAVYPRRKSARVEVRDDGGSVTAPQARDLAGLPEAGRGLGVVAAVADTWGYHDGEHGRIVFFELTWTAPRAQAPPGSDPAMRQGRAGDGDRRRTVTADGAAARRPPRVARPRSPAVPADEPAATVLAAAGAGER
jgi:serine/threonine-protein kinase RsbW